MKIVINKTDDCPNVSKEFCEHYGIPYEVEYCRLIVLEKDFDYHHDPRLIQFIEEYGSEAASGRHSLLVVREIPKGTKYRITKSGMYGYWENITTPEDERWLIAD